MRAGTILLASGVTCCARRGAQAAARGCVVAASWPVAGSSALLKCVLLESRDRIDSRPRLRSMLGDADRSEDMSMERERERDERGGVVRLSRDGD